MHQKGILHCDLKPSNVLYDERDSVRLVDFGQSRSLDETVAGLGTFGYMPPEQARLATAPDQRWDVYGLGATAYKLLTGICPRLTDADRTELTQSSELTERLKRYQGLLEKRPLRPVQQLNPQVDEDLAHIVEACLELEPDARPPSCLQVIEDLERRQKRKPLLCQRPWSARHRVVRFLSQPLAATALMAAVIFPLFVNSYLTIKARKALADQVYSQVRTVNQLASQAHRRGWALEAPAGFLNYVVEANSSIDLAALSQQVERERGGFYDRDGGPKVGAWTRVGQVTILTEVDADSALASAQDILVKNRLLNLMILGVAGLTVMVLLRN